MSRTESEREHGSVSGFAVHTGELTACCRNSLVAPAQLGIIKQLEGPQPEGNDLRKSRADSRRSPRAWEAGPSLPAEWILRWQWHQQRQREAPKPGGRVVVFPWVDVA